MTTGEQLLANSSLSSGTALELLTNPSGVGGGANIYGIAFTANVENETLVANFVEETFIASQDNAIITANKLVEDHQATIETYTAEKE